MANRVTQISPGDARRSQRPVNGSAGPPASGPSGTQSPDTRRQARTSGPSNDSTVRRPRRTSIDRSGSGADGGAGRNALPGGAAPRSMPGATAPPTGTPGRPRTPPTLGSGNASNDGDAPAGADGPEPGPAMGTADGPGCGQAAREARATSLSS